MVTRFAMVVLILLAASSACAESLTPDAARRFVTGKLFAFNCFDGSRGAGRIYDDGSVIGTIQFQGVGPVEWVWLPSGTLKVKGEAVCASLNRPPIDKIILGARLGYLPIRPEFTTQGCDPPSSAMMSACLLPAAQLEDEQIGAKEIIALIRLAM